MWIPAAQEADLKERLTAAQREMRATEAELAEERERVGMDGSEQASSVVSGPIVSSPIVDNPIVDNPIVSSAIVSSLGSK